MTNVDFQETTDIIPAGLNTCTTDSNFPASRGFPGLDGDYRIVGGVTVQANSIPWAVLLHVKTYSGWVGQCAGSILSEHWVVTAAHCCRGIRVRFPFFDRFFTFDFRKSPVNSASTTNSSTTTQTSSLSQPTTYSSTPNTTTLVMTARE